MDSKITIEIVKKNINISIDKLVNNYNCKQSDIRQVWENTELLWEYTQKAKKIHSEDRVNLLILVHNAYLNQIVYSFNLNPEYKIYKLSDAELDLYYNELIKPSKK